MQERSEGGLAMENNKKSLDEIYREVETDLKKGSFKGPKSVMILIWSFFTMQ